MLRFIHTGDIRLGILPDPGTAWRTDRAEAITRTFRRILEKAEDTGASVVLIAGNLFASQPLRKDLEMVNGLFAAHPSLHIFLTAGTADYIRDNSASRSFSWAPNVTFFDEDSTVQPEGIRCRVTGISLREGTAPEDLLSLLPMDDLGAEPKEPDSDADRKKSPAPVRILLSPAGETAFSPETEAALRDAGFTYCALGSLPNRKAASGRFAAWCGSPEPAGPDETGNHGVFFGEIDEDTGRIAGLEFLPMAEARYISLSFGVTPETTPGELLRTVAGEAGKRGNDNIFRFRITGKRNPDITFDLSPLSGRFRVLEVADETEPDYDLSSLFAAHPGDMIGFYIRAFDRPDLSPVEKQALRRGIRALLAAREEK